MIPSNCMFLNFDFYFPRVQPLDDFVGALRLHGHGVWSVCKMALSLVSWLSPCKKCELLLMLKIVSGEEKKEKNVDAFSPT